MGCRGSDKRKAVNVRNLTESQGPACETCVLRRECANAQEGTFCTKWRGREVPAERENEGPAEAWSRGEESAI